MDSLLTLMILLPPQAYASYIEIGLSQLFVPASVNIHPTLSYGQLMGIVKEGVVKMRAESDQGILVGAGAVMRVDQTNPNATLAQTKLLIQWGAGGAPRTTHQQFG